MMKAYKIKQMSMALLVIGSASAATITWDPVVVNTTAADILTDGILHIAVDAASSDDNTINGVTFVGGNPLANNAEGTFYTTGVGVNTTGDVGLDNLLDSHSYATGSPSATSFDIVGLSIGTVYDIQIIAVGDTRDCCSTRTQSFGGDGSFSGDLFRGDPSSVVGRFTATAATQTITVNGSQDGGLSGYQVRAAVPEPSSVLLSLAGLIGLAGRRRR